MNSYKFLQTGGFPMDVNVLDNMQNAYKLLNSLGALAGDLTIIQGCEVTGNTVSKGVVYINGEVLEFREGVVSQDVIIVQEAQTAEFENGQIHEVHYTRYATFGVATTSYPWASFKRALPTKNIPEAIDKKEDKTVVSALLERIASLEEKMLTIARGAEVNVNPDWNATEGDAAILNKPTIASPFLYKGNFSVGDVTGTDRIFTITFPDLQTSNYMVTGSLVSKKINWDDDNDVIWTIREKTSTSFKLCLREVTGNIQYLDFNYVIISY